MKNNSLTVMVQGTTTDAGKTTLVAGLCKILARKNYSVAPFKPQNMALNSAVVEGGEIGRAQWLQAIAAGITPSVDMNPVLIKPASDIGAQIIVHGKALDSMDADVYHQFKPKALEYVLTSFKRLSSQYENIIIEGAGSPAEINLRKGDIANMGFAEAVDCPVILIADIDKGGVFAHIVGTLALLSQSEQDRIIGFVINKFRGDIKLLEGGLSWLEQHTGKPVYGVLPMIEGIRLDSEDAIAQNQKIPQDTFDDSNKHTAFTICVPALPRISNHTDFDSLRYHPNVNLIFIGPNETPPPCDLVILPGSKSVIANLNWLSKQGWKAYLDRHLRFGGKLMGICGGMQMLGDIIEDSSGVDGTQATQKGFGYLPIHTRMQKNKSLHLREATIQFHQSHASFSGYEIHHGETTCTAQLQRVAQLEDGSFDGFISNDNAILGTYLHGIFDSKAACDVLLSWAGHNSNASVNLHDERERALNILADTMEKHINFEKLHADLDSFWKARNV